MNVGVLPLEVLANEPGNGGIDLLDGIHGDHGASVTVRSERVPFGEPPADRR